MSTLVSEAPSAVRPAELPAALGPLVAQLRYYFESDFLIFDTTAGTVDGPQPLKAVVDTSYAAAMARTVADSGGPEFIGDDDPLLLLALPLAKAGLPNFVAVAPFATRRVDENENLIGPARWLEMPADQLAAWINRQSLHTPRSLLRMAELFLGQGESQHQVRQLSGERDKLSQSLARTYEEICLLYGVTQNLRISSTDDHLGRVALDWLQEALPVQGVAILFLPTEQGDNVDTPRTTAELLTAGVVPANAPALQRLVSRYRLRHDSSPLVVNLRGPSNELAEFPDLRQLILVPMSDGQKLFGWLAAFNHEEGDDLGTVEASLLISLGTILAVHSGNLELYRQQRAFVASVVRALTSAIDAKDPYTCGHSDRVARVSVRIAQELGQTGEMLNTIYLAGLLHDVGKIGIDDNVLRKPGRLTEAEFQHIKLHPDLGYRILADLKQLAPVLPAVLYHHEQWDGKGYPHQLSGEEIPLMARIVAVADAYDAMSSDRPYRKGMDEAKVEEIFRNGAGKQWDAKVIEIFLSIKEQIKEIAHFHKEGTRFDMLQWT